MVIGGSVFGILWLILTVWILFSILTSSADSASKLIWVLVVLFLPFIGPILYLLIGPGGGGARLT